jgi:NAD(P)-dependent dehydrogenase (short-subunit alcohol dehydrogenase family)
VSVDSKGDTHADGSRMVNNAGVGLEAHRPALCHLTDEEVWDVTMNINVKSVFLGCKYATGQMLKQEPHPSGDRGWIINMSSIMGIIAGQDNRKFLVL